DARHPSASELDRIAEGVRDLGVPALLLWGARDPVFTDRYLDDLLDRLPGADVHRFPDAGHLVAEDVDVAGAALDWLADRGVAGPRAAEAAPPPEDRPAGYRPLWDALDAAAATAGTALVEMAPSGGVG